MHSRGDASHEFLKGYLPRFLTGCGVVPSPFSRLLGSTRPDSAWCAFRERWGEIKLRTFEEGSLSARIVNRIARDLLDELAPALFRQMERDDFEVVQAFAGAGFVSD